MKRKNKKGWPNEPTRHGLASKGIKTRYRNTNIKAKAKNDNIKDAWNKVQKGDFDSFNDASSAVYQVGKGFASGEIGTGWMADKPYKVLADYEEVESFGRYPFDADARAWTETLQYQKMVGKYLKDLAKNLVIQEEGIPEDEIDPYDWLGTFSDLESEYLIGYSDYMRENYLRSLKENIDGMSISDMKDTIDVFEEHDVTLPKEEKNEAISILYKEMDKDLNDLSVQKRRELKGQETQEKSLTEF